MRYSEFPGEKTYVVFHTEGTGEQGGSGITEGELLASFDTEQEAIQYGLNRYPRITGWEWDNFVININTLTEKGKEELAESEARFAEIVADAKANPHLYSVYELPSGVSITIQYNPDLDGPRKY